MIRIALLGAGNFVRDEHLPAIQACDVFDLKAVYSRSQASAQAVASEAKSPVDIYYDSPEMQGVSLEDLLQRKDISAVIVCLPIIIQPDVIRKAIEAGKHVLSEKPIAKDLATGVSLLDWYRSQSNPPIWSVAENFRFIKPLEYGAEKLREIGGQVVTFRSNFYTLIKDDDKYFNTEWRKVPQYQGGFLLDGGVHFVAGLRYMLAAVGEDIKYLAAFTSLQKKKLPPVDTLHGVAKTQNGAGILCLSYGTEYKSGVELEVVTDNGSVTWNGPTVTITMKSSSGEKAEQSKDFSYDSGVTAEVAAFGHSINAGKADPRQTPIEALKDLEALQKLLLSGESNGHVQSVEL
ncbi:NAD(P)-binding protein [Cryphonectria parasitica EP155]|uniref:NAD(P)-binding protein n=1 Tax=Cryphonectria parasitica (strain ATCC 38755 / EP155) TaxID=660469 RepID=A0A9P5CLK5_CRYP1|nr:NAD(P)-binding protein [Cryphonectria parasitica EP155]KAF3762111.1 NAD(P)-binding protein [Cryphonectria parasitica EP155]